MTLEHVCVAITILTTGWVLLTPESWRGRGWWLPLRLAVVVVSLASGYLATPLFGPEDSTRSLITMAACLWVPLLVLTAVLPSRPPAGGPLSHAGSGTSEEA